MFIITPNAARHQHSKSSFVYIYDFSFSGLLEWDVPDFNISMGLSSVMTENVRLQIDGHLASRHDFYLFTEFMVFGV